jgi:N-acetylmuramoyl-L-alanine amidase
MFRFFVVLVSLVLSLSALNNKEILSRANGFMKSKNKSNQFRAYNDYKNLYLRALMNDNEKLLIQSLSGIVNSGHKLHIDVSQYQEELRKNKPKITYKAPKSKYISKVKSKKKIKIQSSNKLKTVTWKDGKLFLKFEKKLSLNQINYFTKYDTKKKKYQYIFDVHASMLKTSQTLRKKNIDKIKLSQHNSNSLRLFIEDRQKVKISFKKEPFGLMIKISSSATKATQKIKVTIPKRLDRNKVIVIDAGHGGKDPGAIGYKRYREKVVVLSIAKDLKRILNKRGYKVYMTRNNDHFVKLSKRTKYANKKHADIFISIHANAVSKKSAKKVQGIECYFLAKSRSGRAKKVAAKENQADLSEMDYYGKESFLNTINSHNIVAANKLAIDLQRGALGALNKKYKHVKDAGVREGPFWVLVGAQMPSVLVEVGFITHPSEAKRLVSSQYQQTLADGLANGIERYFLNN